MSKYYLLFTSIALLGLSGCTPTTPYLNTERETVVKPIQKYTNPTTTMPYEKPTPHKMALYQKTMRSVASGIQNDSNYRRIALDTPEKKEWFKQLTYRLWDRQITRQDFMQKGLAKYPTHQHEFQFVIDGFTNVCG